MTVTLIKKLIFFSVLVFLTISEASFAQDKAAIGKTTNIPITKLNDTGITWLGLFPKGIQEDCNYNNNDILATLMHEQDCYSGRDSSANSTADDDSGFNYQKLTEVLESSDVKRKQWDCVSDLVTGLTWEVKKKGKGLHHANDTFTWYDSNRKTNGGNIGDWNSRGKHCYGYVEGKPRTYCHTEQFVNRVNKKGLCGFNDWRLPTREELTSLVNFGRTEPNIDLEYFPETKHDFYWSASSAAGKNEQAWAISFRFGFSAPMRRTDNRYARLVRTTLK